MTDGTDRQPSRQPAPNGWADAYRETMEAIWQGVAEAGDMVHSPEDIVSLCAFAAEIRAGIAAGLVLPGTDPTTVRVPLVAVQMRDERPRHCVACANLDDPTVTHNHPIVDDPCSGGCSDPAAHAEGAHDL